MGVIKSKEGWGLLSPWGWGVIKPKGTVGVIKCPEEHGGGGGGGGGGGELSRWGSPYVLTANCFV